MKTNPLDWSLFREVATSWAKELEEARPLERYSEPLSVILRKLSEGRDARFDKVLCYWVRTWLDAVSASCADAEPCNASMVQVYHKKTPVARDVYMSILWLLSAGDRMGPTMCHEVRNGYRTPTDAVLGRLWTVAMRKDRGRVIQAFHAHMVRYVKSLVDEGDGHE